MTPKKIQTLREKIKSRSEELAIRPEHTEDAHFYRYGDKLYKSVTGHLQLLKDPSLGLWRMNQALNYIADNIYDITPANVAEHIFNAKEAPQRQFTGAGDLGTAVHNFREAVFQSVLGGNDWAYSWAISATPENLADTRFISAVRGIKKFVEECSYEPVACELYVADHTLQTGGQVDDIGFVNGELALVDLKTSNQGDKESYYAQVGLYYYMFSKLYGIKPKKLYILHVSKVDGTYNLIEIKDIPKIIKWAKKVVEVSQGLDELKLAKKKVPIII